MNGYLGRAGWTGAWVGIALCWLSGCNAGPEAGSTPSARASEPTVTEAVRQATDRSARREGMVTLPSGERMRRVSLEAGYTHVLVGRVDASGKRSIACVDGAPAAESFVAGGQKGEGQ